MPDGKSSASVVAVDPVRAAQERDAAARAMLQNKTVVGNKLEYLKKDLVLTVPYTLKVITCPEKMEEVKDIASKILESAFQIADTVLNNYNPESEISIINKLPVGEVHKLSAPLKRVLGCCIRVYNSSRGAFNPAVGPLVCLLRDAAKEGKTIPTEEVNELMKKCNFMLSFAIDLKKGTIARKYAESAIDLGGVNKGYIVDYVIEKFNEANLQNVFFEWGGDVRASGVNASEQPWAVGIVRPPSLNELNQPQEQASFIRVVELDNESIATSGDYENLVKAPDGKLYTSIFNWSTKGLLEPSEKHLAQVSVKCYSCMYADALATAALLKSFPSEVRKMLDAWRYVRDTVTDFTTYTRENERVARMFEIAMENTEMRKKRMSCSLPARVIVVGGGLAGCSAAIEAANAGAQVILLEKESRVGGNSAKATSGINAWGTRAQAQQGVSDGGKFFERDTYLSGKGGSCDAGLVKMLSVKSADAIKFLTNLGVPLSVLSQLGGASRKRCHRAPDKSDGTPVPIGFTIMRILENHIRTKLANKVTVMTNVNVTKLLHVDEKRPDGKMKKRVTGVDLVQGKDTHLKLTADAVILATGGFSNDRTSQSLLQEFAPQLASYPTTNGTWATGDGLKMARELGAEFIDMDKVQLHPTGLIDPKDPANRTKYLGPEALRGSGGVLLNKNGERFVNELDLRSVVSQAIIAQDNVFPNSGGSRFAYCVLNEQAAKLFGKNALGFYWKKLGLFTRVEDVQELAKLIGCSQDTLTTTLTQYEKLSSEGLHACPSTGKNVFPCVLGPQGPFYVAYVTPSIHYTMGGCLITPSAEILSSETDGLNKTHLPILGLFGAGEVTGGVHGKNRLGGNSLLECVVFGRIAGDRAANFNVKNSNTLEPVKTFGSQPVELRVQKIVSEESVDEVGIEASHQIFLSLPDAMQSSGLELLQSISLTNVSDKSHSVNVIPCSPPDELGTVRAHITDLEKTKVTWLNLLNGGDKVIVKPLLLAYHILNGKGDVKLSSILESSRHIYAISNAEVAAGATLQFIQYLLGSLLSLKVDTIRLLYSARYASNMPYRKVYRQWQEIHSNLFKVIFASEEPALRWSEEVESVSDEMLNAFLPDNNNTLYLEQTAIIILGDENFNQDILKFINVKSYSATSKIVVVTCEDH